MSELAIVTPDDQRVIDMWLYGRPDNTKRVYGRSICKFLQSIAPSTIRTCTLLQLQTYANELQVGNSSKSTMLSAVKSLLSFANKTGYVPVNIGTALIIPKTKEKLVEKILTEEEMTDLLVDIQRENPKHYVLLHLLYHCGLRINEALQLNWTDVKKRRDGGQVTVLGKGDKTRAVLLSTGMWKELQELHEKEGPVFLNKKGERMTYIHAYKIVKKAGERVGLPSISPHWLRHAHASHALDRGAPISLVSATLGHADLKTTSKYVHARPEHSSSEYIN
jgi:site-specific recombinase XerD